MSLKEPASKTTNALKLSKQRKQGSRSNYPIHRSHIRREAPAASIFSDRSTSPHARSDRRVQKMCHRNLTTYACQHRTLSRLHPCDLASKNVFPNRHRGKQQAVKYFTNALDGDCPDCEERKHRPDVDDVECGQDAEGVLERDHRGFDRPDKSIQVRGVDAAVDSSSIIVDHGTAAADAEGRPRLEQDTNTANVDETNAVGSRDQTDRQIHVNGADLGEHSDNGLEQADQYAEYDADAEAPKVLKRQNRKRGGKKQRERKERQEAAAAGLDGQRTMGSREDAQHHPEQASASLRPDDGAFANPKALHALGSEEWPPLPSTGNGPSTQDARSSSNGGMLNPIATATYAHSNAQEATASSENQPPQTSLPADVSMAPTGRVVLEDVNATAADKDEGSDSDSWSDIVLTPSTTDEEDDSALEEE